jgi:hypothetical protein
MSKPDPEALVALGRTVERAVRRLGAVEEMLQGLAGEVAELAERLEEAEASGVRSWLAADDAKQTREDLKDLIGWLAAVYLRYPDASLPTCWLWHPAAVEELWWLRAAHRDAYQGPGASWARVADWHDRQRPGVVRRLDEAIGTCELSEHAESGREDRSAPVVPLADAAERIATWWSAEDRSETPPKPSAEQLAEADAHQHAERTRSR